MLAGDDAPARYPAGRHIPANRRGWGNRHAPANVLPCPAMNDNATWTTAIARARRVLAADYCCDPRDFVDDGLTFAAPAVRSGRRRFPIPARPLSIGTCGRGVVVLCGDERRAALRALLADATREEIFAAGVVARLVELVQHDGQVLRGPNLTFICSADRLRPAPSPPGVTVDLLLKDQLGAISQRAAFSHALSATERPGRPTVAAAIAVAGESIVGVAAAGADSDDLWQIGVDVLPEAQGSGVGRAVVAPLTRWILDQGRVPYYAAATGNIRSQALAASVGFRPAWTELYAADATK
jgi:GNAT superfamily N-acetyltransferase